MCEIVPKVLGRPLQSSNALCDDGSRDGSEQWRRVAMHQSLEVVLVAPKDALPQTTQGCVVAQISVVRPFLCLQPWSMDQFAHDEPRLF